MASKVLRLLVVGSLAGVLVACGDDTPANPDSSVPMADGGTDAGELPDDDAGSDAGTDGGTEPLPEPTVIALSTTGHDRLYAVTRDADGNIYATGQISDSIEADADFSLMVAKFSAAGVLDTTFGEDGIASVNVAEGGGNLEVARGIVVQSTGRIVIAGTAENDPTVGEAGNVRRKDTDVVLVGFTAAGALDDTFGDAGIARLELSEPVVTTDTETGLDVLNGPDTQWGLALGASDALVVHGTQRATGDQPGGEPRTDSIWAVARLTAAGELDTTFSTDGIVTVDLVGDASGDVAAERLGARASARAVSVLPDGSIVASGYLTSTLLTTVAAATSQQPVIYKILPTGELDATFATDDATTAPGVWHDFAPGTTEENGLNAEAYGAALQGDRLVTMGYGRTTGGGSGTDWVSLRFGADGALDNTYGTEGITYVDAAGLGDNGRFVMTLADGRVVGLGSGRATAAERDAMIAVLTEDGLADTSFAEAGIRLFDLGGDNDGFWGGALSADGSTVAIVGVAGGAADTDDDDSVLFLLPVD